MNRTLSRCSIIRNIVHFPSTIIASQKQVQRIRWNSRHGPPDRTQKPHTLFLPAAAAAPLWLRLRLLRVEVSSAETQERLYTAISAYSDQLSSFTLCRTALRCQPAAHVRASRSHEITYILRSGRTFLVDVVRLLRGDAIRSDCIRSNQIVSVAR